MEHLRWKTLAEITTEDRSLVFQPVHALVAELDMEAAYTPEAGPAPGDHYPGLDDILIAPPPPLPAPKAPSPPKAPPPLPVERSSPPVLVPAADRPPAEVSPEEVTRAQPSTSIAPFVIGLFLLLLFVIATILLFRDEAPSTDGPVEPVVATLTEEGAALVERFRAWSDETRVFLGGDLGRASEASVEALEKQYDTLMLDLGSLPADVRAGDDVGAALEEAVEVRAALQAVRAEPDAPATFDPSVASSRPAAPPPQRRAERSRTRRTTPSRKQQVPRIEQPAARQAQPNQEDAPAAPEPEPTQEDPEGPVRIDDILRGGRYKVDETSLTDVLNGGYSGVGVIDREELRRMAAFSKTPLPVARVDETAASQLPLNTSQTVEAAVLVPNRNGTSTLYLVVENE